MNKKLLLFLLILISIGAVSHVSAADNSTVLAQDDSSEIETQTSVDICATDVNDEILGDTYHIDSGSNLQDAIDAANANDTLILTGTFEIKNTININKAINIKGSDEGATLKPDPFAFMNARLFNINSEASNVVLYNLKFVGGHSSYAGAILWEGNDGTLTNCEFSENYITGDFGGAIVVTGDNLNIKNCIFNKNAAKQGGSAGALYVGGDYCNITNCTFKQNDANNNGGAVVLNGENSLVSECTFSRNSVGLNGGAIAVTNVKNEISDSEFRENEVKNPENNDSNGGGAIYSGSEKLDIIDCEFYQNNARNGSGGAVFLIDYDTVRNSIFLSNSALFGRDVYGTTRTSVYANSFTIRYDENETVSVYGCDPANIDNNNFNRTKVNTTVTFTASMIFDYDAVGSINVYVDGGYVEEENIKVLGHDEAKIKLTNITLTVSGLDVGSYVLRLTTTPDENHTSIDKDLDITVKPATAVITASKVTVALKSASYWSIKMVNSKTNKPVANMYVTLKIYTGSGYKTVKVKTNSKGIATYKTSSLAAGNHKVVISADQKGYTFKTVTSSIKVIKQTALKYKLSARVNANGGSLLSYLVLNKKTGKGVDGVKIKCTIYTGKKSKTYTLTTKKIKGKTKIYHGAVGFSTNAFSAGKHKVTLMPANIKYKGSVSTYIVIKKAAAKNSIKFFRKV